jgi:hypothetical protein
MQILPLSIDATLKTPLVSLKPEGVLEFSGNSYPENCHSFYKPVIDWIQLYIQNPAPATHLRFHFKYFNTSTSGVVVEILTHLKVISPDLKIKWEYDMEDEETFFSGQNFAELLELTFEFEEK